MDSEYIFYNCNDWNYYSQKMVKNKFHMASKYGGDIIFFSNNHGVLGRAVGSPFIGIFRHYNINFIFYNCNAWNYYLTKDGLIFDSYGILLGGGYHFL